MMMMVYCIKVINHVYSVQEWYIIVLYFKTSY